MTPHTQTLAGLRGELRASADPVTAEGLQRFFKTGPGQYGEGDRFLGVRVPRLRRLAREYRGLDREPVLELLGSPWHEERLLSLLILVERYRTGSAAEREAIHRAYLSNTRCINNWDLVDASAEHIVGAHLEPAQLGALERLARSGSLWERRIAIMATFHWTKRGKFEPTLHLARLLLHDPHDLIHKAAGWMLREVGKRDRSREDAFLRHHYQAMPRVMLRYAIEHYPEAHRQAYLRGEVHASEPLHLASGGGNPSIRHDTSSRRLPMCQESGTGAAVRTERVLRAGPRRVFAAFEQADQLARWWGPRDFTNTFERFDFQPGGRWVFVMHAPNGTSFPNESVFREIEPEARIVIEHVVKPWYMLTVTLTARGDDTHLAWVQEFESPEFAARMRPLSGTANEQVLDRLQALLAGESA